MGQVRRRGQPRFLRAGHLNDRGQRERCLEAEQGRLAPVRLAVLARAGQPHQRRSQVGLGAQAAEQRPGRHDPVPGAEPAGDRGRYRRGLPGVRAGRQRKAG